MWCLKIVAQQLQATILGDHIKATSDKRNGQLRSMFERAGPSPQESGHSPST